jgi:predicted DNA-binding transcriptional regulator AlpA
MDSTTRLQVNAQNKQHYLQLPDLTAEYGLKASRVRNLVFRHAIPHIKIGRSLYFSRVEIEAWFDAHRVRLKAKASRRSK